MESFRQDRICHLAGSRSSLSRLLGFMVLEDTHQLDPYKPIESGVKPITSKPYPWIGNGCLSIRTSRYRHRQSTRLSRQCSAELQTHLGHGT